MLKQVEDEWLDYEPESNKYLKYGKFLCTKCKTINKFALTEEKGCFNCDIRFKLKLKLREIVKEFEEYKVNKLKRIYKRISKTKYGICDAWKFDVNLFIVWAFENEYKDWQDIVRLDKSKCYEPKNCILVRAKKHKKQKKLLSTNTSGYRGVSLNKKIGKYIARIYVNGLSISLGYHETPLQAAMARDKYIIKNKLPHKLAFNNSKRRSKNDN